MNNFLKKRIISSVLVAGLLPVTIVSFPQSAFAAEIEHYSRKHISFFQKQVNPLNPILQNAIRSELPRFDYHLLGTAFDIDLMTFLSAVKQYQKEHAGEIAAKNEKENAKFADKVVPWSETKTIMKSAYVFAPQWSFSPIELTGPHKHTDNGEYWTIDAESKLSLSMSIYKLSGDKPQKYSTLEEEWTVAKPLRITDLNAVLKAVKKATDIDVDLENPLHRAAVLEFVKQLDTFKKIQQNDPYTYLMPDAKDKLDGDSFTTLNTNIKRLEDFILKGEVLDANMSADKVDVGFGEKESPSSLGVHLDNGYKVIEYQMQDGAEKPVEVGFMKVRELGATSVNAQPIIVQRDFELGDQVKEYPKTGATIGASVLTTLDFFNPVGLGVVPQGQLDIEYSLARALGVSELHGALSIGGLGISSQAALIAELGLLKRWYMRQLIFSVKGSVGFLSSDFDPNDNFKPRSKTFGGTVLGGLHYQATPDLLVGLDAGWRYYLPDTLSLSNGLNGLVVGVFANYAL